ncbi:uncharacterized protein L199_001497 [Kwoniella botswanensis]|uniref:uncharacterized protein n=1 Tax=Kwoniella botswanensis TaxID=1268659 RepID=UPI00315DB304
MSSKRGSPSSDTESSSKRARTYPVINDYNRDYQDSEADVTLISSDGFEFKYRFSIIGDNSDRTIDLSDETIERSSTVSLFLQTCRGQTPKFSTGQEVYCLYSDLIDFSKKYDAAPTIQLISAPIYRYFHVKQLSSYYMFELGSRLDAPEMVSLALRNSKNEVWLATETYTADEQEKVKNPLATLGNVIDALWTDPSSWSIQLLKTIPADYLFAMLRANKYGRADAEKVADGFVQIMIEMGEYTVRTARRAS